MANSKKKCRHCKEFVLAESGVSVPLGFFCTREHALEHQHTKAMAAVSKIRAKAIQLAKKDIKARKQAIKSLGELHKEAQPEFNRYIRLRDRGQPCISCQKHTDRQIHAGHYFSVGSSPELRYVEANVHAQCSICNNHLSGNQINYRISLIKKIGLSKVEELEGPHDPAKYTREDIIAIKAKYKLKYKELEAQQELL
tara:strand:- start:278 stop:868 length:591 start_codon:yes stop_codon:yes gene_type:complete